MQKGEIERWRRRRGMWKMEEEDERRGVRKGGVIAEEEGRRKWK